MNAKRLFRTVGRGLIVATGMAMLGYAGLILYHRLRYGRAAAARSKDESPILDRFIPQPEIVEHYRVRVKAPAETVLATAKEMALLKSGLVRAIIKTRELAMGGRSDPRLHPQALLAQMQSIGWVVLAERPGREVVLGAVTRPWESDTSFRSIPASEFAAFREPGYVKIVWTLRAEPQGEHVSVFHTETRVSTTDPAARERFRTYWSLVAPGVGLIRMAMLQPIKRAAERRAAEAPQAA
jgi:hypothetical protein